MIKIEKANKNNIEDIERLYIQLFSLMAEYQPYYIQKAAQSREFIEDSICNNLFGVLLAKDGSDVLGFVILQEQNSPPYTCVIKHKLAYIMDFVVDEKYRRKGIGSILLQAAENWAKDRNVDYLELGVLEENISAKKMYEKEGYVFSSQAMRKRLK